MAKTRKKLNYSHSKKKITVIAHLANQMSVESIILGKNHVATW